METPAFPASAEELSTTAGKLTAVEEKELKAETAAAVTEPTAAAEETATVTVAAAMGLTAVVVVVKVAKEVEDVVDLAAEGRVLTAAEAVVSGEETVVLVERDYLEKDKLEKAIDHRFHRDIGKMGHTFLFFLLIFFLHDDHYYYAFLIFSIVVDHLGLQVK